MLGIRWLSVVVASAFVVGCASVSVPNGRIYVGEGTVEIVGEFRSGDEWAVYPYPHSRYDPYTDDMKSRCVSLIEGTGGNNHSSFNGNVVKVTGVAILYQDLEDGGDIIDTILPKKFYNGKIVINGCVRDYVFIAYRIERE